jgi:excisionase family DNA binding protein
MKAMKTGKESMSRSEKLLTIDEVAELLKVPKGWIYQRTRDRSPGTIPFYKLGKYLRFDPKQLQAWLQDQKRGWQSEK